MVSTIDVCTVSSHARAIHIALCTTVTTVFTATGAGRRRREQGRREKKQEICRCGFLPPFVID